MAKYNVKLSVNGSPKLVKQVAESEQQALDEAVNAAKQKYGTDDVEGISAVKRSCSFC